MYVPEIVADFDFLSDDEVAKRVTDFYVQVKESVNAFTSLDWLLKSMAKFPEFSFSGLVSVPQKLGRRVKDVFDILLKDVRSLKAFKKGTDIDYSLLKAGDIRETRFVLGKIIMNTLVCDAINEITEVGEDVIPSINPLQKLEVLEETRYKNTQSMIESNYKLLRDNDSKVRLNRKNVFIEDKPSGKSKTSQLQENTISGKYKEKTTIQKTVNNDEYHQSSQKHFNVLAEFHSEEMKTVHMHKEKDQPQGIYKKYHIANERVYNHNSSLGKIDEDKQVKAKVPRAVGTLLSTLFK